MIYNFTPPYLSSLVPHPVSTLSRYNLRNSNDLQAIDARTNQYYNSFLPSAVRSWNNLPVAAKESDSINSFKRFLNQNKTPVPKYYYMGNRKAQILHTRLRTNCSSLNMDLFLKNISDSPLCRGGGRVVRWCWVNFQCRGVLQFGYSRARDYCARSRCGWGLFEHFDSHLSFLSSFSLSLGDGPI